MKNNKIKTECKTNEGFRDFIKLKKAMESDDYYKLVITDNLLEGFKKQGMSQVKMYCLVESVFDLYNLGDLHPNYDEKRFEIIEGCLDYICGYCGHPLFETDLPNEEIADYKKKNNLPE